MKKLVTLLAVAAFMFSLDANAQEPKQKKKESAKTEKAAVSKDEKKSCGSEAKACCSSKKAEAKKD